MRIVVKPMPVLVRHLYQNGETCYQYVTQHGFDHRMIRSWKNPSPGIVYVIQFKSGDYKDLFKIGFTANWEQRQKQLQNKYGEFDVIKLIGSNNARVAEAWLHWRCSDNAHGHEIFSIPFDDVLKIRKITQIEARLRTDDELRRYTSACNKILIYDKRMNFNPIDAQNNTPGETLQ